MSLKKTCRWLDAAQFCPGLRDHLRKQINSTTIELEHRLGERRKTNTTALVIRDLYTEDDDLWRIARTIMLVFQISLIYAITRDAQIEQFDVWQH